MSGKFDGHNWCDLTQELDAEIDKTAGKVIRQQLPSYLADFRPALLGPLIGHVWFYMWRQFFSGLCFFSLSWGLPQLARETAKVPLRDFRVLSHGPVSHGPVRVYFPFI